VNAPTYGEIAQLITALGVPLSAVISTLILRRGQRALQAEQVSLKSNQAEMHQQMNSRLERLVQVERGEANLQGQKEGREQERQRVHQHPPLEGEDTER